MAAVVLSAWLLVRLRDRNVLHAVESAVQGAFGAPHSEDLAETTLRPLAGAFDSASGTLALATIDPDRLARIEGFTPVRFSEPGLGGGLVALLAGPREALLRDEVEDRAVREAGLRPVLKALDDLGCVAAIPLTTETDVHGVLLLPPRADGRRLGRRLIRAISEAGRRLGPPVAAAEAAMRAALRDAALRLQIEELTLALAEERRRVGLALAPDDAQLVSRSAAMAALIAQLARTAPDDRGVLIVAERGAGGDRVARAVHLGSPRKEGPFVLVDAVGLDEGGVDRALRAAQAGTLYVRDLPALEPARQVQLAAGCSAGAVRLVGSTQIDPATEGERPGLEAAIWELLRRGPLRVPALRERREDIGPLAIAIVRRHARALGKRVEGLTHGALEALCAYDWPGNVRELDAVLSVAVGKAAAALVVRGDLPEWLPAMHVER
ncbi:MAG: sigma 54-interacting transcriptional regulator [Deltaproteobacteria bacterium]|nr:sigma 54-interacting transcriptional regulator [Deltaproteobacteria bacterium]